MTLRRKVFTNPGRPTMKPRGWDGTAIGKQRIEALREPKDGTWSIVAASAACDRSLAQVSAFTVLALLGKYRNARTGECFPTVVRLSRDLQVSRRSVQRHLDRLVERGYLVVLPRRVQAIGAGSRQTSNAYVMLFPPMPDRGAARGDDETVEGGQTRMAFQSHSSPASGLSAAAATGSVAAGRTEPPSGRCKEQIPLRHLLATPATDAGKPCDTVCRSNAPTKNDPSKNAPHAEADSALAREPAAAKSPEQTTGKRKADTSPGEKPAARQVVTDASTQRMPKPPRDPFTDMMGWIARVTGQHVGQVTATALGWIADLEAAGAIGVDAINIIVGEVAELRSKDARRDINGHMAAMIRDLVQARAA